MFESLISYYKNNRFLFILLVFLLFSIGQVLSIKCYQCKEPDPRCRDHFQNDTLFFKPCPANATKCRKYKWEIGDGMTYFERGCAIHGEVSRREGRNCIERVGTFKTRMWYCICDNKDGCNFSSRIEATYLTYTLLTLFSITYTFKHLFIYCLCYSV